MIFSVYLMILGAAWTHLDTWSEEFKWLKSWPGYQPSQIKETKYGRLIRLDSPNQILVFQNGFLLGGFDRVAKDDQEVRAMAAVICSQHPSPLRVLLVGGTLGRLPAAFLEHGLTRLEIMELDPGLLDLGRQTGLPADPRLVLRAGDARALIKESPAQTWDLGVFIIPEPSNLAINRYLTLEFFQEVKRALTPDGVLVLLLPSTGAGPEYLGPELARRTASIRAALMSVFKESRAAPLAGHFLTASDTSGQISLDPDILAERLSRRSKAGPFDLVQVDNQVVRQPWPPEHYHLYFEGLFGGALAKADSWLESGVHQPMVETFNKVLTQTDARLNRDDQPVAVVYGLTIFGRLSQDDPLSPWLSLPFSQLALDHSDALVMNFVLGIGLLLIGQLWKHGRSQEAIKQEAQTEIELKLPAASGEESSTFQERTHLSYCSLTPRQAMGNALTCKFNLTLGAFASGLTAMTILIAALFIYQNLRGYVYVHIGFLIALFMAGLALGSFGADRRISDPRRKLMVVFGLMAGLAWLWPEFQSLFRQTGLARFLPIVVIFFTGLANGAVYPWLNTLAGENEFV
ncbi:MAG: hypothetical protein HQK55_16280, partial [Deltaproteobacteria bacterium]|nr:hypothetical protein [Deltaproteobacteria bacterium]